MQEKFFKLLFLNEIMRDGTTTLDRYAVKEKCSLWVSKWANTGELAKTNLPLCCKMWHSGRCWRERPCRKAVPTALKYILNLKLPKTPLQNP